MKPDLEALQISIGELKKLTDFKTVDGWTAFLFLISLLFLAVLAWAPTISLVFAFEISMSPYLIVALLALLSGMWVFHFVSEDESLSLRILLDQVDKFNAVVKSVDIRDQLEEVGHLGTSIPDDQREQLMDSLRLTRVDLVRALKTEKILRENKDLIVSNPSLFTSSFTSLQELQTRSHSNVNEPLLDDVLRISSRVQSEMKMLKNKAMK